MAIEHTSSKSHHSHSRSRRATVPARRRGRVTRRAQKNSRRATSRTRTRVRARRSRAPSRRSLSFFLSLPSRHPRVSRRGGPTRARLARARRGVVAFARRRGRATDDASARGAVARWTASSHRCFERARRDARAFARRVDGSRSSHRVVRTLDGVAPRARGRVVVASTESNARASPSSVSSLTTGCPPSANQSNRSRDPERRRARSTPRVAARSRCVRVRVRPIHRLDSTRTRDRPPARPSERNSNRHPDRRRASVRPPSTTTRPTERAIDRSIDRSIDAHPSCRDSPSNRTVFSHTRSHSFRRGGENNPPKNRRDAAPCIHAPSSRTRAGVHTSRV